MNKRLDYIEKVAETGSVSRAAEKVHITASALSKFIITKENELGVELFERRGKKFKLTYAGRRYIEWAKKISHMQECMDNEMIDIKNEKTGIIRLGFQFMLMKTVFSKIIPEFKMSYPDIDIVMESTHTHNLMKELQDEVIDFAVTTHKSRLADYVYEDLAELEMALVVPKGHPIVCSAESKEGFKYPWVDMKLLKDEEFVGLYREQESRRVMDAIFEENNIFPKISMQVHTTELTLLSVASNFGITIAYDRPAKFDEYRDSVELLSYGIKPEKRALSIVYNGYLMKKSYSEKFIEICKKYFHD